MEQARLWLAGMGAGAQNYPSAESSSEYSPNSFYASEFPRNLSSRQFVNKGQTAPR
jgi:hypothetical protein